MDFFFVLTMQFPTGGNLCTETVADTITAKSDEGDTAENLFWRAYRIFEERQHCESFGKVLHWSIMPNVLPGVPAKCGLCKRAARPETGLCDGHSR